MQDSKVTPVAVAGVIAGVVMIVISALGVAGVLPIADNHRPAFYGTLALGAVELYRGIAKLKRK